MLIYSNYLNNVTEWPIFISFFTINTGYEDEVKNLITSLECLQLPYYIEGMESKNDWVKNCAMKPGFILNTMIKFKNHTLVWIDADAVVKKYPIMFHNSNRSYMKSIACGFIKQKRELLSGTIYIKNDTKALSILSNWVDLQQKYQNKWDQVVLQMIYNKQKESFMILPFTYIKIFDNKYMKSDEEPVIEHYQASRRFKN